MMAALQGCCWRQLIATGLLAISLAGCSLPSLEGRSSSQALTPAEARQTALGQALTPMVQSHPGESGIYSLADAHDAFAARVLLARSAEITLDVQCYIWRNDVTGALLLEELRAAAERGVRVRLLLDDNGTAGMDEKLAALNTHPNVEVRLFNPFVVRKPKVLGFITDYSRASRRMHNKSFSADNQATIIGGRNVGDEYFGAGSVLFADLDVLAVGPVVDDVSRDFDLYWASESSYPAERILPAAQASALETLVASGRDMAGSEAAGEYVQAVERARFLAGLLESSVSFEWARTTMVSDDPAKGLGKATEDSMLLSQLGDILGKPTHSVDLVSPYLVPTAAGVEVFSAMVKDGIRLRILTNSLDATDVAAVHAGYAKRRRDMLAAGVTLYEMRRIPAAEGPPGGGRRGSGLGLLSGSGSGGMGSSGSSLHAKTFGVDGERIFVGSFNFDPRSARYNTELGFVIESPAMARDIALAFDSEIPRNSYSVRLDDEGDLYWIELREGNRIRHDSEPETGPVKRALVWLLSLLPIDPLL